MLGKTIPQLTNIFGKALNHQLVMVAITHSLLSRTNDCRSFEDYVRATLSLTGGSFGQYLTSR